MKHRTRGTAPIGSYIQIKIFLKPIIELANGSDKLIHNKKKYFKWFDWIYILPTCINSSVVSGSGHQEANRTTGSLLINVRKASTLRIISKCPGIRVIIVIRACATAWVIDIRPKRGAQLICPEDAHISHRRNLYAHTYYICTIRLSVTEPQSIDWMNHRVLMSRPFCVVIRAPELVVAKLAVASSNPAAWLALWSGARQG